MVISENIVIKTKTKNNIDMVSTIVNNVVVLLCIFPDMVISENADRQI